MPECKQIETKLDPGRAALLLITHSGDTAASYSAGAMHE